MEIFNTDIFDNIDTGPETPPVEPLTMSVMSPFDQLKATSGAIEIRYTPRVMRSNIPFMDFKRAKDRQFIDLLLQDIKVMALKSKTDRIIMAGWSTAKRGLGVGSTKQTWQQFIDELVADKVVGRKDFSTSQLKHLRALLTDLSKGDALAGCGSIDFINANDGKAL